MTAGGNDRDARARLLELGHYLITLAENREPNDLTLAAAAVPLPSHEHIFHGVDDSLKLGKLAYNEYNERLLRAEYLSVDLFGEPSWDILLDLFIAKTSELRISITSACIASHVPLTTALRWLSVLEEAGLIIRTGDTKDKRRSWVELTESGYNSMASYFRDKGKKKSKGLRNFTIATETLRRS